MIALPPLGSRDIPSHPVTPAATLTIVDAPTELNVLPVGTRIAGAVMAAVDGTAIALKTEFGTIMARSAVPLQKDALVSLLVQTAAPGMVLRIIEVVPPRDEQAPSAPMQGQPAAFRRELAGGDAAATPAAAVAMAKPAAALGVQIEAVVLRSLAGTASAPAVGLDEPADSGPRPAAFPADTRLTLRMLDSNPKDHPTGTPGDGSPSRALRLGAGQTITASVVRTDGAGRPLLTSSAGLLMLATPMQLPHGWSGEFEIIGASAPPGPPASGLAAEDTASGSRAGGWQTLEHILGSLSQSDPAAARHVSEAVLPRPTSSLAANVLKVLGLLRDGDVRRWLGNEAYLSVARTRPDLLERLAADIRKLAPGADGNTGSDWRTFIIPLIADGALAATRMRIRSGARQNAKGASDNNSTRFVLDLALSRLGRMQIDGLVQAQGRQLDLIVRTERPLAADVQDGIRHILVEAGVVTGLRGAVGFRLAPTRVFDADGPPPTAGRPRSSLGKGSLVI
jgi:hypothetical protein